MNYLVISNMSIQILNYSHLSTQEEVFFIATLTKAKNVQNSLELRVLFEFLR